MNLNSKQIVKNPLKGKKWWKWPRPTREFSMNLKKISNIDIGLNEIQKNVRDSNLRTCDINKIKKLKQQRINSSLHCEDIIKRKSLFKKIVYPFNKLKNEDIEGTKTKQKNYFKLRKPLNPLNPQYNLPKAPPIDIEVPKFLRDNINVDDIIGTSGQSQIKKKQTNQTNFVGDIEGSKPRREKVRKNFIDTLDISDIQIKSKKKFIKDINPLDPQYRIKYSQSKKIMELGEIEKNKSRVLHKKINKEDLQLKTEDIEGCRVSSAFNRYFRESNRRQFSQTNQIKDIKGTQVNSIKKGLQTRRQTNPLNPEYKLSQQRKLNFKGELQKSIDFDNEKKKLDKKCLQSIAITSREYNIINFELNPHYLVAQKILIKKPDDFSTKSEKKLLQIKQKKQKNQKKQIKKQNKEMIENKENIIQKNEENIFQNQKQKKNLSDKITLDQMMINNPKEKSVCKFKIRNDKRKSFQKQRPTYAEKFLQLCSNQAQQFYMFQQNFFRQYKIKFIIQQHFFYGQLRPLFSYSNIQVGDLQVRFHKKQKQVQIQKWNTSLIYK